MDKHTVTINRAPVMTLWAAVVAEHLGYDRDAALTLGKAVAGLSAQAKGRRLGFFLERFDSAEEAGDVSREDRGKSKKASFDERAWVHVCGRPVPAEKTKDGIRAVAQNKPIDPGKVQTYLRSKFGASLEAVRKAMEELAATFDPKGLEKVAYRLYETFRPKIAPGRRGWGQKGKLDLELIRSLATTA